MTDYQAEKAKFSDLNDDAIIGNLAGRQPKPAAQPNAPISPTAPSPSVTSGSQLGQAGSTRDSMIGTSDPYRNAIGSLGNNISSALTAQNADTSKIDQLNQSVSDMLKTRMDELAQRRQQQIDNINKEFEGVKTDTANKQANEVGASASTLARIGGALGESASGMGYMQKLDASHRTEMAALESKRQQAIMTAENAYSDKQFEMAEKLMDNARVMADTIAKRKSEYVDTLLKVEQLQKYQRDNASETLDTLISNGISIDDLPQGYLENLDMQQGLPGGTSAAMWEVGQAERKQKNAQQQLEQGGKLLDVLNKMPAGTPIMINDNMYYGTQGTGKVEIGPDGQARSISIDQSTGRAVVSNLGFMGKPTNVEIKQDSQGRLWSIDKNSGIGSPVRYAQNPAEGGYGTQGADWSELLKDGMVWDNFGQRKTNIGQCGAFVNDLTGIGVGDTLESKIAKTDKAIGTTKPVAVGDVMVLASGGWTGHVALVNSMVVKPDGSTDFRLTECNQKGDGRVSNTRWVNSNDPAIRGFGRGKLSPMLNTGSDAPPGYGETPTFGDPKSTGDISISDAFSIRKNIASDARISGYVDLNSKYENMRASLDYALQKGDTGSKASADQALITLFNKMLDPGSVVKEGEYARSAEGQSALTQAQGYLERLKQGGSGINNETRRDMVNIAGKLLGSARDQYAKAVDEYSYTLGAYKADPQQFIPGYGEWSKNQKQVYGDTKMAYVLQSGDPDVEEALKMGWSAMQMRDGTVRIVSP